MSSRCKLNVPGTFNLRDQKVYEVTEKIEIMSVPNVIFIDTNIFDEQNYNFDSSAFSPFIAAVKGQNFVLLLPDPIMREVNRHIKTRSLNALKALEDAKRKAPFLSKWKSWPLRLEKHRDILFWELQKIVKKEWGDFLQLFDIKKLSYDEINLNEIMNWYDERRAPFGKGKKRKEFPDALAIASVSAYAKQNGTPVAVISKDGGIKNACDTYTQLLYFKSLPAFTEAILSADELLKKAKALLGAGEKDICNAIDDSFCDLGFYLEGFMDGEIDGVGVNSIVLEESRIVGLGELGCTVAFEAYIEFSASFECYDPDGMCSPGEYSTEDSSFISGTAKVTFNKTWDEVKDIHILDFDKSDIAVAFDCEPDY